jgi:lipoprotein-anchoring transpeptidase ErfK/SrfK
VHTRFPRANSAPRIAGSAFAAIAVISGAAALVVTGLFAGTVPAVAQQGFGTYFGYQSNPRPKRYGAKKKRAPVEAAEKTDTKKPAEKTGPNGPVYAVISVADQHVTIYDSTGRIARSRVSTGMAGHRTPTGVFSVIGKERWHHSNIYSGAPMPFMQRITWSGVAMHAGVVPGYPASHGCIRLPASFAPQLYGMTKMGARVVVSPRDTAPVEFSHSLLPLPKMQPAPTMPAGSQQASASEASVELASMGSPASTMTTAAVPDTNTSLEAPKLLNPIAYAGALKERAAADKTLADQATKDALAAAQAAGADARQAMDDVRKAAADLKTAEAAAAALDAKVAAATLVSTQSVATAPAAAASTTIEANAAADTAARTAAQSELTRAQAALDEARARETAKSPAAFLAVEAWKRAAAASDAANDLINEAGRRREQVSVFISKKEGRVFIRQDWKEVYEAPVTIRDPERPLGTHVYTAVEATPDGSSMRWTAISLPPEANTTEARRSRSKDTQAQAAVPAETPETAAGALDRVELPAGVRERIAELLWTGGSIIVSDNARSDEMDHDTDFIVMTR